VELIFDDNLQKKITAKLEDGCRKQIIEIADIKVKSESTSFIVGMYFGMRIANKDNRKFVCATIRPGAVLFDITNRSVESILEQVENITPKKSPPLPEKVLVKMVYSRLVKMDEEIKRFYENYAVREPEVRLTRTNVNGLKEFLKIQYFSRIKAFKSMKKLFDNHPDLNEEILSLAWDMFEVRDILNS